MHIAHGCRVISNGSHVSTEELRTYINSVILVFQDHQKCRFKMTLTIASVNISNAGPDVIIASRVDYFNALLYGVADSVIR